MRDRHCPGDVIVSCGSAWFWLIRQNDSQPASLVVRAFKRGEKLLEIRRATDVVETCDVPVWSLR